MGQSHVPAHSSQTPRVEQAGSPQRLEAVEERMRSRDCQLRVAHSYFVRKVNLCQQSAARFSRLDDVDSRVLMLDELERFTSTRQGFSSSIKTWGSTRTCCTFSLTLSLGLFGRPQKVPAGTDLRAV